MIARAERTELASILELRRHYLRETNCQIRYNACHERGWSDTYLLFYKNNLVGYGSVKGLHALSDRDTIFECYILPQYRDQANDLYAALITTSGATYTESQTNDQLTTSLLYRFSHNIRSDVILFKEGHTTNFHLPGTTFRKRHLGEPVFGLEERDIGTYVLEYERTIVATGDFLLHYNKPYADLFMEVSPTHRQRGFGMYILQELKRVCYEAGRIPAARCNVANPASRKTLLKAGMEIAGCMLVGDTGG